MAKSRLTALDADILASVLRNEVREKKTPEAEWPSLASQIIRDYTGSQAVDTKLLDWILEKVSRR
ncbi:conserved hypothetical protein [Mesorhizobium plurifarium]|uniref:Uncharacterized protein n=1 Tax=Mesorhizobium plurifarium TaxID=69974 RepID=A0A090G418_MESPL|nr:conserved hypothetical protein [Mesorhizobium plurifarium]